MPVPHFNIKITQRSKGNSAVAGAAYQAGEKLFSEYDQKTKNYTCKKEVVYTEIMLPPNAPPEYADRATLWNSVEEIEKQWNSQLARRFVAALPREVPMELLPQMVKEYCEEQFVSKGMCCDFAIHDPDPPGHNPHCHFMLTMRAIDENGKLIGQWDRNGIVAQSGKFSGDITGASGTFSGRLDSQTGNIAGWDISSEGLSAAKMKIYSNKSINANDSPDDIFTDDPYTRIYKDGITTDQIFANEINFTPKKGSTYYKGTTKTVTVVTDVSGSTVKSTELTFIDGMLVHETV